MRRFVDASIDDFEALLATAVEGRCEIDDAVYPPGCTPPGGTLRFRLLSRGTLKIEVDGRVESGADDFRFGTLFSVGSYVFGDVYDLACFFRGPVAERFGMTAKPAPTRPAAASPADDAPLPADAASWEPRPHQRSRKTFSPGAAPRSGDVLRELSQRISGQDAALVSVARAVSGQLSKTQPAQPECLVLIGPTGTGKTSAVRSLPGVLDDLGCPGAHVFRVDCGEITTSYDVHRFLGASPGLVGYTDSPPLVSALREPGCIVLFDEFEKGHEALCEVVLGLLDEGRVVAPDGTPVEAPGVVITLTSNAGAEDLAYRLRDTVDCRSEQAMCRDHLLEEGWPAELVGRIGSFAVFRPLGRAALRTIAEGAIRDLAGEFGLEIEAMPPVLIDVVDDLADSSEIGARAFRYAARQLLLEAFVDAVHDGIHGAVLLEAGPPPRVVSSQAAPF